MSLSVRVVSVEKSIVATLRRDLSLEEQKKTAAAFAQIGIEEARAHNRRILGRDPPMTITVDGRKTDNLESVNPNGGNIIAEWELIEGVLAWIGKELVECSPSGPSGAYIRGHKMFADGTETIPGEKIPPADEYLFTNVVPYARRLEVGKTKSGRPFLIQVPNKIYERVAKDARRKFGTGADIQYTFREPVGAYKLQHDQASRDFSSGTMKIRPGIRKDRRKGAPVIPPAIVVRHKRK